MNYHKKNTVGKITFLNALTQKSRPAPVLP
jgi:hypothetical protein